MKSSERRSGGHLVFFIDDERNILAAIRRTLADEPYEIQMFLDPDELLEQVAQQRPSVVVSDFYMPAITGPDLLKKVSEIDENIARVILTGKPDIPAVAEATLTGRVHSFLIKPWEKEVLQKDVRNAIWQHEMVGERNAVMARIEEAERKERRDLLKREAEAHLQGVIKRPLGSRRTPKS